MLPPTNDKSLQQCTTLVLVYEISKTRCFQILYPLSIQSIIQASSAFYHYMNDRMDESVLLNQPVEYVLTRSCCVAKSLRLLLLDDKTVTVFV
jgi:hypothetical protein